MEYNEGVNRKIDALKKYLLGKINYDEYLKMSKEAEKSYNIEFETDNFEEFSKKMFEFFDDKELVRKRLEHEREHYEICKKYGFETNLVLKSYLRDGKERYRPSVAEKDADKKKREWSKKKFWEYTYDQVSMEDSSDTDKLLKKMLLDIKEIVFSNKKI